MRVGTSSCRTCEWIALAYFAYTAILTHIHHLSLVRRTAALAIPLVVWAMATLETRFSRRWSSITRDWAVLGLILICYLQADWFTAAPLTHLQDTWLTWDRLVLGALRPSIEAAGGLFPAVLEGMYLSLYAIPPLCLAALYVLRRRHEADRFLTTLFLGSLAVYAILPHFPTLSPRVAFPAADLPHFNGFFRSINVFLLDHFDITTSVFPSGHVAVAFSAAFGMLRVASDRRWLCSAVFLAATLVYLATIYGRYHYAVDGLASIGIASLAWLISEVL